MAEQEEGWPLGLQPLDLRAALLRNRELNASLSFNTLLTRSPISSSHSSSDLDTQSTGSFFHDKSITLGSLIGISNILELSRRSTRGPLPEPAIRNKKNYRSRTWCLSLCSRENTDAVSMNTSLGHFLETERRASATNYRRSDLIPVPYGADDFSHNSDSNPLFEGGRVAPPRSGSWAPDDDGKVSGDLLSSHANGDGTPLLLSCLCGS